jgi:hypothetical protein
MEETLEELNEAIRAEEHQWNQLSIQTRMFSPDLIFLSAQIDAICSILINKGMTTQEEADLVLKKHILSTMKEIRTNYLKEKITKGRNNGIIRP